MKATAQWKRREHYLWGEVISFPGAFCIPSQLLGRIGASQYATDDAERKNWSSRVKTLPSAWPGTAVEQVERSFMLRGRKRIEEETTTTLTSPLVAATLMKIGKTGRGSTIHGSPSTVRK